MNTQRLIVDPLRHAIASGVVGMGDVAGDIEQLARHAFETLNVWRERARARRALAAIDPHLQRDIGMSHFKILQESSKPFWKV